MWERSLIFWEPISSHFASSGPQIPKLVVDVQTLQKMSRSLRKLFLSNRYFVWNFYSTETNLWKQYCDYLGKNLWKKIFPPRSLLSKKESFAQGQLSKECPVHEAIVQTDFCTKRYTLSCTIYVKWTESWHQSLAVWLMFSRKCADLDLAKLLFRDSLSWVKCLIS